MEPHFPPVLFLLICAAVAPAIAGATRRIGLSVVVVELLLGIAVGPQGFGLVAPDAGAIPLFFLSSGMRLDVRSIFTGVEGFVLLVVFFAALVIVRLPLALLLRSELGASGAWAVTLFSATTLSLIVVITRVAVEVGALQPSHAAPMVGAGMLTVMLFPALGARLAGMQRGRAPALTLSMGESGEHL